jgi:hypothetical protein
MAIDKQERTSLYDSKLDGSYYVAYALVRAASRLVSMLVPG